MPRATASIGTRLQPVADSAAPMTARTREVRDPDLFGFLEQNEGLPRVLFESGGEGIAGAGVAKEATAAGSGRFADIKASVLRCAPIEHHAGPGVPANIGPRWVGGFSFAPGTDAASPFPDARFILPSRQLTVQGGRAFLTEIQGSVGPRPRPDPYAASPSEDGPHLSWDNVTRFPEWADRVRSALDSIRSGRLEKVVLSRRVEASVPDGFPMVRLLRRLQERSPTSRVFLIQPDSDQAFFGASPEPLVTLHETMIATAAVAGSRARGRTPDEDAALERSLLASSKDAWEHELVCRSLRAALTVRGRPWSMPVERRVLKLPNVQHLETRFVARSGPGEHLLDLAERFHPTPAVAGFPRDAALELLARLEPEDRGWYSGAVGWFDSGGDGELAVAIRSGHLGGGQLALQAGCGIVNGSDPAEEWDEARSKLALLQDAVESLGAPG